MEGDLHVYSKRELEADDDEGFIRVCQLFGLSVPADSLNDRVLVHLLDACSSICVERGLQVPCSSENKRKREEKEKERELAKEQLASKEKERDALRKAAANMEEDLARSQVCWEVIEMARAVGISVMRVSGGKCLEGNREWGVDLHSYFLPFVNMSVDAVNFVYGQVCVQGECEVQSVGRLMAYVQKCIELRNVYLRYRTSEHDLDYRITLFLLEQKKESIEGLCSVVEKERKDVIKSIFYLCSKGIAGYTRETDEAMLL
ncbi:hypothetical protein NEAUS03_1474 [Nematocida ausubeli]|nr:hypothetical protein NEAUS03_1474 [Nematocida ausubeli]